jgi:hypothetical protein
MPQELTLRALAMALARQRPRPGLIHHSYLLVPQGSG